MMKKVMMNKAMVVLGVTGIVLASSSAGVVALAEAKKEVPVEYNNSKEIIDEDAAPEFMVSVPSSVIFTDDHKKVDTSISMSDLEGKAYTGAKQAVVTVKSANEFKLKNGEDTIAYSLTAIAEDKKETKIAQGGEVATLAKTKLKQSAEARMLGKAKKTGKYTDTLTYTVTNKEA